MAVNSIYRLLSQSLRFLSTVDLALDLVSFQFLAENGGTDSLSVLDLGKAAKLLTEVKAINEAPYLGKIAIIQAEINFLENAKSTVLKQAQVRIRSKF